MAYPKLWSPFINLILLIISKNTFSFEGNTFDPFMDSKLFAINWLGPLDLHQDEILDLGDRHLMITTNKKETYRCILPESNAKESDGSKKHEELNVDSIMEPLFSQEHCSYRIESYWTYELCHGKSLRQYHETREQGAKPKVQEYFLGLGNSRKLKIPDTSIEPTENKDEKDTASDKLPVRDVDGTQLPFYEVVMDDGTRCDLTNLPRKTRVLYVCHPEGRGEIYEFKESSTCEYEIVVFVGLLCKHPLYRPKTTPVNEIRCHSMIGSPIKPSEQTQVDLEVQHLQSSPSLRYQIREVEDDVDDDDDDDGGIGKSVRVKPTSEVDKATPPTPKTTEDPQSVLSSLTDKQTLRNILSGSQCLRGGSGWWHHEVCVGKFAKQFHKDKQVEVNIMLGFWDKQKHLQWLQDNPGKKPRPVQDRKLVSLFYSGGDMCDLTGKPRTCEVRLKCLPNIRNKHAVILSLSEPSTCQYVLTVESNLFCDMLKHADENGLFDHLDL